MKIDWTDRLSELHIPSRHAKMRDLPDPKWWERVLAFAVLFVAATLVSMWFAFLVAVFAVGLQNL